MRLRLLQLSLIGLAAMAALLSLMLPKHSCEPVNLLALMAPTGFWAALLAHLGWRDLPPVRHLALGAVVLMALALTDGRIYGGVPSSLGRCKINLHKLAADLEMYSVDHRGEFPPSLELLGELPVCPAGGGAYGYETHDGVYRIYCTGLQHEDACIHRPNFPEYRNESSFLERP